MGRATIPQPPRHIQFTAGRQLIFLMMHVANPPVVKHLFFITGISASQQNIGCTIIAEVCVLVFVCVFS